MTSRITTLLLAVVVLALPHSIAIAQSYPNRTITVVVPSPPGGGDDFIGRLFAQHLGEATGQPVVVENLTGAGATIAYASVVRAAPDGYRLLITNSGQTTFPALYSSLSFDPVENLEPISLIFKTPFGVTVTSKLNARTLPEFIQLAKSSPGKLNFGSGGNGTGNHIAGELFKKLTGTDIVHVPFKGAGPAMTALLGGQIEVMFATMTTAGLASQNAAGTVRVLAVSGDKRSTSLPSVPTAAEAGLEGYNALIWWGVSAPKGTPPEIIARLNAEVRSMLQKPAVRQKLQDMGGVPLGTSSAEAKEQIARETKELTAFVSTLGIKQ